MRDNDFQHFNAVGHGKIMYDFNKLGSQTSAMTENSVTFGSKKERAMG
jgi:hypothetical protein